MTKKELLKRQWNQIQHSPSLAKKDKSDSREKLAIDVAVFLASGGQITVAEHGESSMDIAGPYCPKFVINRR